MTFDLSMPPSVNAMFATDWKSKRRFASKEYGAWKVAAGAALMAQYRRYGSPEILRPIGLRIRLGINYQSDIANREKAISDLIVATLNMPDDRYIEQLIIERDQSIVGARVTVGHPIAIYSEEPK